MEIQHVYMGREIRLKKLAGPGGEDENRIKMCYECTNFKKLSHEFYILPTISE